MWKFICALMCLFVGTFLQAKQKNNFQFCPSINPGVYKCEVVVRDLDNRKIRLERILGIASTTSQLLSHESGMLQDINIYDLELWDNFESYKLGNIENESILNNEIDLEDPNIPYNLGKIAFTSDGHPFYSSDLFSSEGWSLEQEIECSRRAITSLRKEKSSFMPLISAPNEAVDIEESKMVINFLSQYQISIYIEFTKTDEEIKNISLSCSL